MHSFSIFTLQHSANLHNSSHRLYWKHSHKDIQKQRSLSRSYDTVTIKSWSHLPLFVSAPEPPELRMVPSLLVNTYLSECAKLMLTTWVWSSFLSSLKKNIFLSWFDFIEGFYRSIGLLVSTVPVRFSPGCFGLALGCVLLWGNQEWVDGWSITNTAQTHCCLFFSGVNPTTHTHTDAGQL